jgi:hypothetical protein
MSATSLAMRNRAERMIGSLESLPLGQVWVTLVSAIAIGALFVAWHAAAGLLDTLGSREGTLGLTGETRIQLVVILILAFLMAVQRHAARRWTVDLDEMRALTRCSDAEFAALTSEHDPRMAAVYIGVGVLLGFAMVLATTDYPEMLLRREGWNAHMVWIFASNGLLFGLLGRTAHSDLVQRRIRRRVVQRLGEINLLDRRPLGIFARQGLRSAIYWAVGSSIASLLALDLNRVWPLFVVIGATTLFATMALLGPTWGVHRRLREAKGEELVRVRARIEEAKERALAPRGSAEKAAALPGLLAYESRIEGVPEWPFDTPTLVRFGALVLLVTGSWLGGAVVERLLAVVLDAG